MIPFKSPVFLTPRKSVKGIESLGFDDVIGVKNTAVGVNVNNPGADVCWHGKARGRVK